MFLIRGLNIISREEREKKAAESKFIKDLKKNDPLSFLLLISQKLDNPTIGTFNRETKPRTDNLLNAINAYARSVAVEWNKEKKKREEGKGFFTTESSYFSAGAPLNPLAEYCTQNRNGNYNIDTIRNDLSRLNQEDLSQIVTNLANSYTTYQKFSRNLLDKTIDGTMLKESGIIQAGKAGMVLTGLIVYASLATAEIATRASLFTTLAISYGAFRSAKTIAHKLFKDQTFAKNLTAQFAKPGTSPYADTPPGIVENISDALTKKTLYSPPIAEKFINNVIDTLNHPIDFFRSLWSRIDFFRSLWSRNESTQKKSTLIAVDNKYSKHPLSKLREPRDQKPEQRVEKSSLPRNPPPTKPDPNIIASEFLAEAHSANFVKRLDLNNLLDNLYSSIDRLTEEKFIEFMKEHYPNDHEQFLKNKKNLKDSAIEDSEKTTLLKNLKFNQLDIIITENHTENVLLNLKIYEESKELEALISDKRFDTKDLFDFAEKHYPEELKENESTWSEKSKKELSTIIIEIIYSEENFEDAIKHFTETLIKKEKEGVEDPPPPAQITVEATPTIPLLPGDAFARMAKMLTTRNDNRSPSPSPREELEAKRLSPESEIGPNP
jgi:hypothetical protein